MTKRSTFRVGGIYQPEKQRKEIQSLKGTLGVAEVVINIESRIVTFEHDESVTVDMIVKALRALRLNPSLISPTEYN